MARQGGAAALAARFAHGFVLPVTELAEADIRVGSAESIDVKPGAVVRGHTSFLDWRHCEQEMRMSVRGYYVEAVVVSE